MRRSAAILLVITGLLALWVWRSQLFVVSRPGEAPRVLRLLPPDERDTVLVDVTLPDALGGARHLHSAGGVLLVHYWAPWEYDAVAQARGLDSLTTKAGFQQLDAVLVTFDPFPSVARFVGRHRLQIPVLFDAAHHLSGTLPCPSVPYTYAFDRSGRVAIAQPGRVDWFADRTRAALRQLVETNDEPRAGSLSRPNG